MILHHQSVNRVQKVHLSSNVTNLISYPGNIHNMRMHISLMLSNAFSSYQFGLTPLKSSSFYHLSRRFSTEELQVHKKADFYVTRFNSSKGNCERLEKLN